MVSLKEFLEKVNNLKEKNTHSRLQKSMQNLSQEFIPKTMWQLEKCNGPFSVADTIYTYEPVHEISNNVVCVTSKASDQPAHICSLIRAFASRLSIL